jgi:Fe-Mn family superoxide dismutase
MVASIAGAQSEESSKEIRAALTGGRIKPLSFDPAVLNGPSEKLIRSHWENN